MSFETKFAALSTGVIMPYVEQGDAAGLPVIFIHGLSDSHLSYGPLLAALPSRLRAFALTLRGHGDASRAHEGNRPEDFADDVAAFLDAMELPAAVIVGHSMGSLVARAFVQAHRARALGLVLIGAFSTVHNSAAVQDLWQTIDAFGETVPEPFVREFQVSTLANPIPDAFLEMAIAESLKLPAYVWRESLGGMIERDRTFTASGAEVPTLIAWGDRDVFCSRADQDSLVAVLPNARLTVYPGIGHALHWEIPVRFAADLSTWLRQIEFKTAKRAA